MGACKSRQSKPTTPKVDDTAPLTATLKPAPFKLRPDAQPYVPVEPDDEPEVKERWELFLDQKKRELATQTRSGGLRRHRDGHYTTEYRSLLTRPGRKPPGLERSGSPARGGEDLRGMWRAAQRSASPGRRQQLEAKVAPAKKRKPTALKKAILAQKGPGSGNPLWEKFDAHVQKVNDGAKPAGKEALEKPPLPAPRAQDDAGALAKMPFGISDRCFLSEAEDAGRAQRHRAPNHAIVREFVDMPLTPALEAAVTELLFALRRLKVQELGIGGTGKRFAVGFREVSRLISQPGAVKALIVAPDVEVTSGVLEDKIATLAQTCKSAGVPVVYALSRRQLGQAIQKNVAISVLAVQDVRGALQQFAAMLDEAARARAGA